MPKKSITIATVCDFYAELGGGVKSYIDDKLRAGSERGHRLVVIAPGPENKREDKNGGTIHWVKTKPFPLDSRYYSPLPPSPVHRLLDDIGPDVVEGDSILGGGRAAARWRGDAFKAMNMHQDFSAVYPETFLLPRFSDGTVRVITWPIWKYIRWITKHYDVTITASEWLRDRLLGFGISNAVTIPWGINITRFGHRYRDERLRTELLGRCEKGPGAVLVLVVGRYHPEKRVPTLIKAVKRLNGRYEIGLVVYGDGPFKRRILSAAAGSNNVFLAGYTKDRHEMARIMASADMFLHGSTAETFGLVVAEALASGTPLVVPKAGGAFDFYRPEVGEVYEPGDITSCAEAIERLITRGPAEVRRSIKSCGPPVRDQEAHFDKLFEFYQKKTEEGGV